MDREELLKELSARIDAGEISQEEVNSRIGSPVPTPTASQSSPTETKKPFHFSVNKILYFIGAAIVIIGVAIFIFQIWDSTNSFIHIAVTLGLGLLLTAVGSALLKQKPEDHIGPVFHTLGGVLIPTGVAVTLLEFNITNGWAITAGFAGIFVFYLLLSQIQKHAILTFFAILSGTATIILLHSTITNGTSLDIWGRGTSYQYLSMVIGVSYVLLARSFRGTQNEQLTGILHFLGSLMFLSSAFSLVISSTIWELVYFLVVFGGIFLAVFLKSRSILALSTLFLLIHVSYITGKYFADSIGWPVSLVILGFLFIGLGYMSVTINKRYI